MVPPLSLSSLTVSLVHIPFQILTARQIHLHHQDRRIWDKNFVLSFSQRDTRHAFAKETNGTSNGLRVDCPSNCLVPRSARLEAPRIVVDCDFAILCDNCCSSNVVGVVRCRNVPAPRRTANLLSRQMRQIRTSKHSLINFVFLASVKSQIFEHRDCSKPC